MGRDRKSIAELKRTGSYRPSRHGYEPTPLTPEDEPAERLELPAKLDADAAAIWNELAELLAGSIRRRDIPALVELCRWIARADKIAVELDKLAPGAKEFKGLMVAAGIATDKVSDLTKRFGISPADRARLRTESTEPTKAKVETRPKTTLDKKGPPRKGKG